MVLDTPHSTSGLTASSAEPNQLELLETVASAIDQGFLVVDRDSKALGCNEQFLKLWGIPPEIAEDNNRMMGHVLASLVEPDDFVQKIIAINSDPDATIRDEVQLTDGRIIERFSRPCDARHARIHRVWCFRDRTAERQAEVTVQRQQWEIQEQQERIIKLQQTALAELSTPLMPISQDVMVMPLIGTIDTGRAQQIMESLLTGVSESRATTVIMDITGVPVVDTQVAHALIQAARAVRLLGTNVVLTGISPQVAQTLVAQGVAESLRDFTTYGTLQEAIAQTLMLGSQPAGRVLNTIGR